jgi:hypothetical protein
LLVGGVALEVAAAEVLIHRAVLEDVVDGGQDGGDDGHQDHSSVCESEVLQEPRVQLLCGLNRSKKTPTSGPTTQAPG